MSTRVSGALALWRAALLLGLLILAGLALVTPAQAVEEDEIPEDPAELEEEPPPDIEELCREGTIAEEYCPERYEEPSWFQWLIYPLLIAGVVMVVLMALFYLVWQPHFAREREEKMSRR